MWYKQKVAELRKSGKYIQFINERNRKQRKYRSFKKPDNKKDKLKEYYKLDDSFTIVFN